MMNVLSDPLKALAALFLFSVLICALFVSVWDLIHGTPIPAEASTILSAGIGYCLTALGFSHASSTINNATQSTVNNLVKAQDELNNTKTSTSVQ